MNKQEVWKDIPGYEGYYQASTLGRVRSLDRELPFRGGIRKYKGKIMEGATQGNNRPCVMLSKDGKYKMFKRYKLIMLTFVGPRPKGYDICHLNDDCFDNRIENLRYDTRSQNNIDRYRNGSKGNRAVFTPLEVLYIRELYKTGNYTQTKISKMFDVGYVAIWNIVHRKTFYWLNDDGSIDESNTKVS